jgi:hypothetical protein
MSKKLTIEITPAQARALVWAINSFSDSYEGTDWEDADFKRAQKALDKIYSAAATITNK